MEDLMRILRVMFGALAIAAMLTPSARADEFVDPRSEAMRIAQATHQPVLSRGDESSDMKSSEVSRIDESGNKVAESEKAKSANAQTPASTTTTTESASANQNMSRSANE